MSDISRTRNIRLAISIVIPIFNEQETLEELYKRITLVMEQVGGSFELIFVNDGSLDHSLEIIRQLHTIDSRVKFINFSRNFGHQIAISAGIDYCSGEDVIVMDGDLQDQPELIPDLISKRREGYDVVYAVRNEREGIGIVKSFAYRSFYRLLRGVTNIDIPVDAGDYRLMSRRVADALRLMPERNRFVRGLTSWIGHKQTGIVYARQPRFAGKTKYSWRKLFRLALDGITSFSFFPLQLATYLGFIVSGLCLLYVLYAVYAKLVTGTPPRGWTSLMVVVLFLGGVQLVTLGIIGEYLGRIFDEVKHRPVYIIDESCGFNEGESQTRRQSSSGKV